LIYTIYHNEITRNVCDPRWENHAKLRQTGDKFVNIKREKKSSKNTDVNGSMARVIKLCRLAEKSVYSSVLNRESLCLSGTIGRWVPTSGVGPVDAGDVGSRVRLGRKVEPLHSTSFDGVLTNSRIARSVHGILLHGKNVAIVVFVGFEVKLRCGGVAEVVVTEEVRAVKSEHLLCSVIERVLQSDIGNVLQQVLVVLENAAGVEQKSNGTDSRRSRVRSSNTGVVLRGKLALKWLQEKFAQVFTWIPRPTATNSRL
jgi:hypothetical protein